MVGISHKTAFKKIEFKNTFENGLNVPCVPLNKEKKRKKAPKGLISLRFRYDTHNISLEHFFQNSNCPNVCFLFN